MPNAGYMEALGKALQTQAAMNTSYKQLGDAYNTARGDLTANNYYQPFYDTGVSSNSMYGNALGLNGATGNDAANAAFRASPGYQFRFNQGMDALNRSAASRGMLASGNQSMALNDYGQNQASSEWNNWLNGLNTGATRGMGAAAGMSGLQTTLANLDYGYGKDLAGVSMGGTQMANSGIGNSLQQDAAAGSQNTANLLGGILGGLKLGASVGLAPVTGGGSLFGNFISGLGK